MAVTKVRALYDFTGEPETSELSITAGEELTVTRHDVGEGWWEGTNVRGETGLFPQAYVEEIQAANSLPPAMPPPPLPEGFKEAPAQEWNADQDWGQNWNQDQGGYNNQQGYEGGDWDDDWDDDSEGGTQSGNHSSLGVPTRITKSGSAGDVSSMGKGEGKTTVRRNFNRFSAFVKSGVESYVLGTLKSSVPEHEKVYILETDDGSIMWQPNSEPYSCVVASPKKESKLKGLKSFIAYQLTPTSTNIQVSRRYKHFDWLHERLEDKFSLIPIPPLPDKQISGRYEEQFIEHRRVQLQKFVNCMCRHPVLSRCSVWQHFMTCTDEKRWKTGKRIAEKDELVGANYFATFQAPEHPLDIAVVEKQTDSCFKFIHGMDGAVKNLMATSLDQTKKHQGPYKREYQRIGQAFSALGHAFEMEGSAGSPVDNLTHAIKVTGETYNDIGRLFEEQPKADWEPLGDMLHIYKGILSSFPDILAVHRDAIQKRKECEKHAHGHDPKMDAGQLQEVYRRTDVISFALLAEMNHFHSERTVDFRLAMQNYLKEQINFYEQIVEKLQRALTLYDQQ